MVIDKHSVYIDHFIHSCCVCNNNVFVLLAAIEVAVAV